MNGESGWHHAYCTPEMIQAIRDGVKKTEAEEKYLMLEKRMKE